MPTPQYHSSPTCLRRRTAARPLLALVALVALSGANCPQMVRQYAQPLPRALPQAPSLQQVIDVVNDNSGRVQSLYCTRGTVSTPGFPSLRLSLAFQRVKNFRLRAETGITGAEVDLGSNENEFWFWMRRAQPAVVYYCRHDRYATSAARQVIPVEPEWIVAALGVVTFDPAWQHQGPFPVGSGRVEIRSTQPASMSPDPVTRITVVDESRGIVLEQHLYNQSGQRLATAVLSKHQRDNASGVTLPRHIEITWPPTQFELHLDLTDLQINRLDASPQQLFTRPEYPGYKDVDLADVNLPPNLLPAVNPSGGPTPPLQAPQGAPAAMRGYGSPSASYASPSTGYSPPQTGYAAPPASYTAPPPGYSATPSGYSPPSGYSSPPGSLPTMPAIGTPTGPY